ncbi:MAG: hypothetical protein CL799_00325 [Chromatiales bacterium]|jgi:hypothetical protein|nr:hypothetical protein [Chromatiales bacterium]
MENKAMSRLGRNLQHFLLIFGLPDGNYRPYAWSPAIRPGTSVVIADVPAGTQVKPLRYQPKAETVQSADKDSALFWGNSWRARLPVQVPAGQNTHLMKTTDRL